MAYRKGQVLKFKGKREMEAELKKIRETHRAYKSGKPGEWKIKVGEKKKTKKTKKKK